jgi:hypothetical protein
MKKRKNPQGADAIPLQNPVAKYAYLFNRAQIFCDKSKYSRKAKHQRQEASPIIPGGMIGLASCFISKPEVSIFIVKNTNRSR